MKKRLTRAQSNERNRRELLEKAEERFLAHGYHGASVEAIAEAAGLSKGAVYSRFGSKDELFLELLAQRIEARQRRSVEVAEGLSGGAGFERLAEHTFGVSAESRAWQMLLLEFRLHAMHQPDLLRRYAALHRRTIAGVTEVLGALFERAGTAPPMSPRELAVTMLALDTGLCLEQATEPELDTVILAGRVAKSLSGGRDR